MPRRNDGQAIVDAYVRRSGDAELLSLLLFHKCYRAMGLPATGKTTLAHALAGRLALAHLSSDVVRKRLAGLRPSAHQLDGFERGLYSRSMSRRVYAVMRRKATRWLRHGQSVVLDATYGQPAERAALRQLARRRGVRLQVIVCRADESVLRARLVARALEPSSISDAASRIVAGPQGGVQRSHRTVRCGNHGYHPADRTPRRRRACGSPCLLRSRYSARVLTGIATSRGRTKR